MPELIKVKMRSAKGIVVNFEDNDKVLLVKRSSASQFNADKWEFVGGKLRDGESYEVGLVREAKEESGLDIQIIPPFKFTSEREIDDGVYKGIRAVTRFVIARSLGGNLIVPPSTEIDSRQWIDQNEVLNFDLTEPSREAFIMLGATLTRICMFED